MLTLFFLFLFIGNLMPLPAQVTEEGSPEANITLEPLNGMEPENLELAQFAYYQLGFVIKGSNLSGDITVDVEGTQPEALTLGKTTLSKNKVESPEGDTLYVGFRTLSELSSSATLSFSGGATASQNLAWTTIPATTTSIADLYASGQEWTYYHLQDLTISYMESESVFYLQNGEYGIKLNDEFGNFVMLGRSYDQGDKIDHMVVIYTPGGMSSSYISPIADPGPASAQNQTVEPTTLTLEQLQANKAKYVSSLVKIEKVEFYNTGEEGTTFPASAKNFSIRQNQDQTTFKARTLNASFADEKVPDTATIVGIVTAPSGTIVGMRSPDDILNATYPGDPEPEPEPEPEPGTDLIAGENILLNAGFEEWGTPSDFNPDGDIQEWTIAMGYSKETTIIKEGEAALKIANSPFAPSLYQSIGSALNPIFTPGDTYRMTIWYYVETSDEGQDVSIASYWNGSASMGELTHDEAVLNNGEYFTSVGQWSKKEVLTTVPEGAVSFEFRLKFSKKASVIVDSFSFCKMTDPNAPAEIKVLPEVLQAFQAAPGKADSTNLTIEGINLKENIKVEFLGTDAGLFGSSTPTVANDGNPHQIRIYYRPTQAGEHQAQVILSSKDADTVKIDLNGKCVEVGDPTITVNTSDLTAFTAKLGKKMEQTVLVSASNMTSDVLVKREGEGMAHFKISTTAIGKNFTNSPVVITYEPTEEGKHQADIVFYSVNDKESVTVKVSGTCTSFEAGWHETFETMEAVNKYGDIYAEADQGVYHLVNAISASEENDVFEGKQGLKLGQLPSYVEMDFDVLDSVQSFSLVASAGAGSTENIRYGVYVSTDFGLNWKLIGDTLSTKGAGVKDQPVVDVNLNKPVRIRIAKLSGDANNPLYIDNLQMQNAPARTPSIDEVLALNTEKPLKLMMETFDSTRHNKAVALEGWRNILLKGQRPWWTYQHKDILADTIVNYSAKATAFHSTTTQVEEYEMWMVTPALDGTNTESKMFTFRVMGDLLPEKDTVNTFDLYYIEKDEEGYYKQVIEVDMPTIKDHNGEWREFHIDLKNSEIADVFFMAFRFAAPGGKENASVFYIDDVSYGRTDLPVIEANVNSISFTANQFEVSQSDTISVKGINLTEPISISFTGNNPSNFDANVDAVPAEGGKFVINFLSFEAGIHSAYLRLSSKGAADKYIPVEVKVSQGVPTIVVAGRDLKQELTVKKGETEAISEPIIVNGVLLTDSIYLSLEGEGAKHFTLSREIMRGDSYNESFTITFHPQAVKDAEAIVRLSSKDANDVLIEVKGINENNVAVENPQDLHLYVYQHADVVYVEADHIQQVRLFSLQGKEVMMQQTGGAAQTELHTHHLPSGIYILQVITPKGSRQVKLIL